MKDYYKQAADFQQQCLELLYFIRNFMATHKIEAASGHDEKTSTATFLLHFHRLLSSLTKASEFAVEEVLELILDFAIELEESGKPYNEILSKYVALIQSSYSGNSLV